MTDDPELLAIAKAINGPWRDVPAECKFTLQQLRDAKWEQLSISDQNCRLQEAKAVMAVVAEWIGTDHFGLNT
jgi:hypothetical protein